MRMLSRTSGYELQVLLSSTETTFKLESILPTIKNDHCIRLFQVMEGIRSLDDYRFWLMAHLFAKEDLSAIVESVSADARIVFRVSLAVEPLTTYES